VGNLQCKHPSIGLGAHQRRVGMGQCPRSGRAYRRRRPGLGQRNCLTGHRASFSFQSWSQSHLIGSHAGGRRGNLPGDCLLRRHNPTQIHAARRYAQHPGDAAHVLAWGMRKSPPPWLLVAGRGCELGLTPCLCCYALAPPRHCTACRSMRHGQREAASARTGGWTKCNRWRWGLPLPCLWW
jgi:hypothetical protein